jgi:LemA protein
VLGLGGCGYNDFQRLDEGVKAAWSEVLNQYQRRADLIPEPRRHGQGRGQLRAGDADQGDRGARQGDLDPGDAGARQRPEAFDKFQKAQGELSGALSRLLVVAEQYPNLRANQAFQDLRVALEGTENRITVARNRYVQTVAEYNVKARSFPTNLTAMMFGYKVKPNFTVQNEAQISVPPSVNSTRPRRRRADRRLRPGPGSAMRSFVAAVLLLLAAVMAAAQGVLPVPPLSGPGRRQTAR